MGDALNYDHRTPVGVCALITPWNLPLYLLTWKVAPALAMGNAVVVKPSEWTPLTAAALAELSGAAGLPPGVLNVVHGTGAAAGAPMTVHDGVQLVSFTGGTETGRRVGANCGEKLKKCSLELGGEGESCVVSPFRGRSALSAPLLPPPRPSSAGKNPFIVFDDCDLDACAKEAARAAFLNQGQICLCTERMLVHRAVYDDFRARLVAAANAIAVGDPSADGVQNGALVHPSHLAKVERMIARARADGGAVLCGGGRPEGLPEHLAGGSFIRPTVLEGLAHDAAFAQTEVFGPVCSLHPFDDEAEAVALANGTRFGLAASVWTADGARLQRVAQALETGMVWANCWLHRDLRVPFGGVKDSGIGREGGLHSIECYSQVKNICQKIR